MTPIASPAAVELARRATALDYFQSVGTARGSDAVVPVSTWRAAAELLTGDEWIEYTTEASNNILGQLIQGWHDKEAAEWNSVCNEVDGIIKAPVSAAAAEGIPRDVPNRARAVEMIIKMVRLACVERHYDNLARSDYFWEMFGWLEKGHVPCGALVAFPGRRWWVF